MKIAVIGGGVAGLTAAYHLVKEHNVTLFESQKQLGGRARCIAFADFIVDHGFHLLSTADRHFVAHTSELNLNLGEAFRKTPCKFEIITEQKPGDLFRLRDSARPFNLFSAVFGLSQFTLHEKIKSMHFIWRCLYLQQKIHRDVTLDALLIRYRQNGSLKEKLWEPLSLALLNTPSRHASAIQFIRAARNLLLPTDRQSEFLLPRQPLCRTLIENTINAFENSGGRILLNHKIDRLTFDTDSVRSLHCNRQEHEFDHIVVATNPHQTSHLLSTHASTQSVCRQLAQFRYEPQITIYFSYQQPTRLSQPINLFAGITSQWAYDISPSGDQGLLAVTINGNGPHMSMSDKDLAHHVHLELERCFKALPEPADSKIVREKTTHLAMSPETELARPTHTTDISRLWISGYYCQTGIPASLESAINSGKTVAELINKHADY